MTGIIFYLERPITWDEFHEIADGFNRTNCNYKSGHWWGNYEIEDYATRNMEKHEDGYICLTSDFDDGKVSTYIFISSTMDRIEVSNNWGGGHYIKKGLLDKNINFRTSVRTY